MAFARVVGDGGLCFHIQEIIVHPDHRNRGIAKTFLQYIFRYLKNHAVRRGYIGVFVGKGLEHFYEEFGSWRRPTNEMGPGMKQFWDDEELNNRFRGGMPKAPAD